ncbi:MAG: endonuclease domain-containing protein [Candidatus Aminicenantes bacterium]|nr:endonuclease domain-containing protein [Candidatus Aminicenantes bacterium]
MTRKIIPYKPHLVQLARELRNISTLSEVLLWQYLKKKKMMGFDFHRQKPVDRYIVDFFCPELMLAIELDGESHDDKFEIDIYRQMRLENIGVHFLRFTDLEIKTNIEGVLQRISDWIKAHREDIQYE